MLKPGDRIVHITAIADGALYVLHGLANTGRLYHYDGVAWLLMCDETVGPESPESLKLAAEITEEIRRRRLLALDDLASANMPDWAKEPGAPQQPPPPEEAGAVRAHIPAPKWPTKRPPMSASEEAPTPIKSELGNG